MIEDSDFPAPSGPWIGLGSVFRAAKGQRWQQGRKLASAWWEEGRWLMRCGWKIARRNRRMILVAALGTICLLFFTMPRDRGWLEAIRHDENAANHAWVQMLARQLSFWGDFAGFNLVLYAALCTAAFMRRSIFIRRLAIAAVLGSVLTAGLVNTLRLTTGRARPSSDLPPGFYGPSLSAKLQSFPSAHTATSFGASVPVAVACPPVGIPLLIVSGGVAWSRMENNRHHPSDVLVSILLSMLFGIPLGLSIRRHPKDNPPSTFDQQGDL